MITQYSQQSFFDEIAFIVKNYTLYIVVVIVLVVIVVVILLLDNDDDDDDVLINASCIVK